MKRITYEDAVAHERVGPRKDRRKPRRKTTREELYVAEADALSSADRFTDPELQRLHEAGKISNLLAELKSGKEATVYLVDGPEGLMAAKIYADLEVRSFKNDRRYRDGRFIADERTARAVATRSRYGLSAQQEMWVHHEYSQLWFLHQNGIPVPKPMIGPEAFDIHNSGRVVLMELIGDELAPAPRLADLRLDTATAEEAFEQSVALAAALFRLGKVHADLSTYNLLWWEDRVVLIDLPQMIDVGVNPGWRDMLERDAINLCRTFRAVGHAADPQRTLQLILSAA